MLAWGALDALRAGPERSAAAVQAATTPAAGASTARVGYWRTFKNVCRPYDRAGARPTRVAACTAPDGTHWALQSLAAACSRFSASTPSSPPTWPGSCTSRTGRSRSPCSRSHRTGRMAARSQGLFGRLLYDGKPVHGFSDADAQSETTHTRATSTSTRSTRPTARAGNATARRLTHVGQRRLLLQLRTALRAASRAIRASRAFPARGERHRVTVMGPGVTPDVQWEGAALGSYDRAGRRRVQLALRLDPRTRCGDVARESSRGEDDWTRATSRRPRRRVTLGALGRRLDGSEPLANAKPASPSGSSSTTSTRSTRAPLGPL